MNPDVGGNATTESQTLSSCCVASTTTSGQTVVPVGSDRSTDGQETATETIEYPEGQTHGVTFYVQLNDNNRLYDLLTDAQRRLNNEREENADSNNPHQLGEIDASWTDGVDEIGFFSSRQEYGKQTEHGFTNYYGQYLNLYSSVEDAQRANNPAKRQIRVQKRSHELVYEDGNDYTWPGGYVSGKQREGSLIKIQASYVSNPSEAIAHAFELIEATGLLNNHELNDVKQPIPETVRFRGLESHHRVHNNHEHDSIETLRDSARLVGSEGDGHIQADFEKGHHQIYGVETDSIEALGHDSAISWDYRGDDYSDRVEGHYLKCYRHKRADSFAQTDPRAHPKIEVKARGAYPGPAWNAVKQHLDEILNAHTSDLAGIPAVGLVSDNFHDGQEQDTVTTQSPTNYRLNLKEYFKSTGLKKDIIGLLVNNRTDSAKDILYTVIRLGRPVPYDELKDETGLTKRTIRKWVARLEELGVVRRKQSGSMFVRMSDFVRNHLRGFLEKLKPVGDIKRAIKQRKQEREAKRQSDSETASSGEAVAMTDGGTETVCWACGKGPEAITDNTCTNCGNDLSGDRDAHPPPD